MINLTEKPPDLIAMEIKMHLPQIQVIHFLQKRGYEIKAFAIHYPALEEFLINEPASTCYTFTATKDNQKQNLNNHYLKIFENEIKMFLNDN